MSIQPTFFLIWHLLLLHLSVDVLFTCPNSWGYYAILENVIEQDRLLAPAVGGHILLWEPTGMWQRCCTQFFFVKLKQQNTSGRIVHSHLLEQFFETYSHELQLPDGNTCLATSKAPCHNSIYWISHAIHYCRNKPYLFTFVPSRFTPDCI